MGLVLVIVSTAVDVKLYGIAFREVSLVDYLMIWPALCLAGACLVWPGVDQVARCMRARARPAAPLALQLYVEISVAIGLAYGLIATVLELLWQGWRVLPGALVLNLMLFPFLGLVVGLRLSRAAGEPRWSWRFMRFSMRTMMLLIAYLSAPVGVGRGGGPHRFAGEPIFSAAFAGARYCGCAEGSASQEPGGGPRPFADCQATSSRNDSHRIHARPERLPQIAVCGRKGKAGIPQVSLASLIADGGEDLGRAAEVAAHFLAASIDYYSKLAAKYEKAMREPWLPIEPDGPRP